CDRSLKFQVTTPLAPAGLLAADFSVFALDLVLASAFTLAGFFLAASFFFTRFITHSPLQADQHRDAARLARFVGGGEALQTQTGPACSGFAPAPSYICIVPTSRRAPYP